MLPVKVTLFGILLLAWSQTALAQSGTSGALSVPQCDQLIDATYNQLSNAEKAAKLTAYGGCRKSKADQHLRRQYQRATAELRQWEGNAKIQAREQIREHATTATNIMTARHKVEREAHKQNFDSRIASLQLQSDAMTTSEFMAERKAINKERQEGFRALQEQQKQETRVLAKKSSDSNIIANQEIGARAQAEEQSLNRQLEEKAKHIEDEYKNIIDGPGTETPNEAAARRGLMIENEPVGQLEAIEGSVNIIRTDGKEVAGRIGLKVYQGDIVATNDEGAASIRFIDDTTFAVSENANLTIDEYVYDPESEGSAKEPFNILKAVFLFTSGLIGRDDPKDLTIDTPVGSIGIRG